MSSQIAYKCGSGAVMTFDPRGRDGCIGCDECTCVKGHLIENGSCRTFIQGDDF